MSDEFATLATKEARVAKAHEKALEWAQGRKFPPPGYTFGDHGPVFDYATWKVVYNGADFGVIPFTTYAVAH